MGLAERAAENASKLNPANPVGTPVATRKRIPMSLPMQKLQVPEMPGYHLHWMLGKPERLLQADRAGYEFVNAEEIDINSVAIGGDASHSGSTDMGTRVSVIAGGDIDGSGQPLRLYLMKQKSEWYEEDQNLLVEKSEAIADTLRAGITAAGESGADKAQRYVDKSRTQLPSLFKKPNLRSRNNA